MVESEGEFPKTDGSVWYSKDQNKAGYRLFDTFEQETLSVTATAGSVSYSEEKDNHIIKNIGSNVVYVNFDAAATTSSWKIDPSDFLVFDGEATAIHAICDTALTSTIRIIGQN